MKKIFTILLLLFSVATFGQTVIKPVLAEYRSAFIASDGNLWSYVTPSNGSVMVTFPLPGSRLVADGVGGFNSYLVTATDGTLWINYNDGTKTWNQFTLDSTGGTINAILPDAMGSQYVYIKPSDSSVWYGGNDTLHLLHSTGGGNYNFVKISGSIKFKKVLIGFFRIVGLTTTGLVYTWERNSGSIVPGQKTTSGIGTGVALDIWTDHYDYAGCIIPNVGETSGFGWPYVWGSQNGVWQGPSSFAQPTAIASTWGITTAVKQVCAGWNTTHLIDSLGHMWGLAYCSTNGELGNGTDFANKYNYAQPYSWTLTDGENPSGATMIQIGSGITWSKLWNNTWFVFYNYAEDASGNFYDWGANKSYVLNAYNCNQSATYRNALDITTPKIYAPLDSSYSVYNFTLPTLSAGSTQTIYGTSGTLTASGNPARNVNATGGAILNYFFASHAWTCTVKPGGAGTPTFGTPTLISTSVSGLVPGSYTFQDISTDNNGGTAISTVNWTVNAALNVPYIIIQLGKNLVIVPK